MQTRNEAAIIDICCYISKGQKKLCTDPSWRTLKWSKLIAQPQYAEIRDRADTVFAACSRVMCDCPIVQDIGYGGLQLAYEDNDRVLTIKIVPSQLVSYQTKVSSTGQDATWYSTPDPATDFARVGRYISGVKATTCYNLGPRVVPVGSQV